MRLELARQLKLWHARYLLSAHQKIWVLRRDQLSLIDVSKVLYPLYIQIMAWNHRRTFKSLPSKKLDPDPWTDLPSIVATEVERVARLIGKLTLRYTDEAVLRGCCKETNLFVLAPGLLLIDQFSYWRYQMQEFCKESLFAGFVNYEWANCAEL